VRADGRTDMTKLTVAFRNSANAPKNELPWSRQICFKVAYIYTDVTGMMNNLETGLRE
jgi:hypothetical protein